MASTESSFPVLLSRDLPFYTGTLGDGDSILVLVGNTTLQRASSSKLFDHSVFYVEEVPNTSSDAGQRTNITWDSGGVYTYLDGEWGKSPRFTGHWEDFTEASRFLRVDGAQELSEDEQAQGIKNLGITEATNDVAGLVKKASVLRPEDDWSNMVPSIRVMMDYVNANMTTVSMATTDVAGIVLLADKVDQNTGTVPTSKAVYDYIKSSGVSVSHATFYDYGTVRLASAIASNGGNVPTAGVISEYIRSQSSAASTAFYGTVKLASSISASDSGVPTAAMVANSVANMDFSTATDNQAGVVKLAKSISAADLGVTTGQQVYNYFQNNFKNATTQTRGVVQLATSIEEGSSEKVPTAALVKEYIADQLKNYTPSTGGSSGSTGTGSGDKISGYRGAVNILGPSGEQILVYDSNTHTLTVGKGIKIKQVHTTPQVNVNAATIAS